MSLRPRRASAVRSAQLGLALFLSRAFFGIACGDEGVVRVTAIANTIVLQTVNRSAVPLQLHQLAPHQSGDLVGSRALSQAIPPHSTNQIRLPRYEGERDRLFDSFVASRVNDAGRPAAVGTNQFAGDLQDISRYPTPFPTARSKKGLQVQMLDDALALGVKHASLNVNLTGLIDSRPDSNSLPWRVDGDPVYFRRGAVEALDRQVRILTDAKVVVAFILLTYASGDTNLDRRMLHPGYSRSAPNRLGLFNAETPEGIRHLRGSIEFLADRYSRPIPYGGWVANYILGNEVNSHWFWANMGRVSMEQFTESYLKAARIAATAIRKASSGARLYLSLEHHWNIRYPGGNAEQAFPGRAFLERFNRRAREQGNFEWHLAFHPYPENLFEPRTWNDQSATQANDTPRITFKNLEVLPRFLQQAEMLHDGRPRRIILSEQGFHTVDGPNGELWQAAGYAYAYYKADKIPEIDAFILHRHVDHGQEGGLKLGLWTRDEAASSPAAPKARKKIYEVFRLADTPEWEQAFSFALPVIGIQHWSDLLPPAR